jgi:hypothetical protein
MADLELPLMKMLQMGPWQKVPHGPKITLARIAEAMGKMGTAVAAPAIVEPLLNVKGRGWVQTDPKIILKEEWPTAEFQLWLTPLGKTELQKRAETAGG